MVTFQKGKKEKKGEAMIHILRYLTNHSGECSKKELREYLIECWYSPCNEEERKVIDKRIKESFEELLENFDVEKFEKDDEDNTVMIRGNTNDDLNIRHNWFSVQKNKIKKNYFHLSG